MARLDLSIVDSEVFTRTGRLRHLPAWCIREMTRDPDGYESWNYIARREETGFSVWVQPKEQEPFRLYSIDTGNRSEELASKTVAYLIDILCKRDREVKEFFNSAKMAAFIWLLIEIRKQAESEVTV